MKWDVAVIGGGFWGTAVAHEARRLGATVCHMDDGNVRGASRNAAGIVSKKWYVRGSGSQLNTVSNMFPEDWDFGDFEIGLAWLERYAGLERTGEIFWSYLKEEKRARDDVYLLPSYKIFEALSERINVHVSRIERTESGWRVVVGNGGDIDARSVVLACGAFTDKILEDSSLPVVGVKPLVGRAVLARVTVDLSTPLTYMSRPYTHFTLRKWEQEGVGRIGDTVEVQEKQHLEETPLLKMLGAMAPGSDPIGTMIGYRPICKKFTVEMVAPNLVVATGGHRVGLGLSGAVAQRVLRFLKMTERITL